MNERRHCIKKGGSKMKKAGKIKGSSEQLGEKERIHEI